MLSTKYFLKICKKLGEKGRKIHIREMSLEKLGKINYKKKILRQTLE